jgi:hypothetical protein
VSTGSKRQAASQGVLGSHEEGKKRRAVSHSLWAACPCWRRCGTRAACKMPQRPPSFPSP